MVWSYEKAIIFRTANHPVLRGIQKGAIALFCAGDTPFEPQSAKPLPRLIFSSHDLANPRPPLPGRAHLPVPCKSATVRQTPDFDPGDGGTTSPASLLA